MIEKCNEFKRPLCIGYIDCEKAFDFIEHKAIFKASRSIGISEICITILDDIYTGATERVHVDSLRRNTNTKRREAGRPSFPQINTAAIQKVFKNAQLEEKGLNTDGEKLWDIRFADDVVQTTEDVKDMEHHCE